MNLIDLVDLTEQPWYIDIAIWAGVVTSVGIIVRQVVWPVLQGVGRFIVAAPRIAESVNRMVELLETDLLRRVEQLEAQVGTHVQWADAQSMILAANGATITANTDRLDALASRVSLLERVILGPVTIPAAAPEEAE